MRKTDVQIGMKVVPTKKTAPGWEGLEQSINWKSAQELNQPFLYVTGYDEEEKVFILRDKNLWEAPDGFTGDFFRASDFRPYKENKK